MTENIFVSIINMSITASVAVVLIIFFKLMIGKKLPGIFNYALWAIVLFRLLIPFSVPSEFSVYNVLPLNEKVITQSTTPLSSTIIQQDIKNINLPVNNSTDPLEINKNPLSISTDTTHSDYKQKIISIASWIWLIGVFALFLFSIYTYLRTLHRLKEAVLYRQYDLIFKCAKKLKMKRKIKVYVSNRVFTPVVCGMFKPRIILPVDIYQSYDESVLEHIITHELVHIKRFDYVLKPISRLVLCVYWFNPLMWIAFKMAQKDMEISCDEKVISVFDHDIRGEYALSLIKLAEKQNLLSYDGLLAFGERNIKRRIKSIMSFKKAGLFIGIVSIILLVALNVILLTNGQHNNGSEAVPTETKASDTLSQNESKKSDNGVATDATFTTTQNTIGQADSIKPSEKVKTNDSGKSDEDSAKAVLQKYLYLSGIKEGSRIGLLTTGLGIVKDNDIDYSKRTNEYLVNTNIKYEVFKNTMLQYVTDELFKEKFADAYKNINGVLWVMDIGATGITYKIQDFKLVSLQNGVSVYNASCLYYPPDNGQKINVKAAFKKVNGKLVVSSCEF